MSPRMNLDRSDALEVCLLARGVVVVVEIVEPHDVVAAFEQANTSVAPNETGRPGDQYVCHDGFIAKAA